ncbi:hypothetical protein EVAR_46595_1 [Eumeta japonica]|uniref:Uncharacterized protein n=1 Tax=Eumeta variegata TaxID=151549 RepID=A0A4C1WPM8_EUMVA|nr:hypothetical protein EVAR_46595_1 [Eumeta japonica]
MRVLALRLRAHARDLLNEVGYALTRRRAAFLALSSMSVHNICVCRNLPRAVFNHFPDVREIKGGEARSLSVGAGRLYGRGGNAPPSIYKLEHVRPKLSQQSGCQPERAPWRQQQNYHVGPPNEVSTHFDTSRDFLRRGNLSGSPIEQSHVVNISMSISMSTWSNSKSQYQVFGDLWSVLRRKLLKHLSYFNLKLFRRESSRRGARIRKATSAAGDRRTADRAPTRRPSGARGGWREIGEFYLTVMYTAGAAPGPSQYPARAEAAGDLPPPAHRCPITIAFIFHVRNEVIILFLSRSSKHYAAGPRRRNRL